MLPTGDITGIVLHSTGLDKIVHTKESELNAVLNIGGTSQHLYFTSDENIEEGDCVFSKLYGLGKVVSDKWADHKAIAPMLVQFKDIAVRYGKDGSYKDDGNKIYLNDCYKIVASSDESLNLPQIPQSFIKQYVEAGGSIDEIMVEQYYYAEALNGSSLIPHKVYKFRTDSNNCVIIHTVKDSWSREEVETLVAKAFKVGYDKSYTGFPYIEEHLGPAIKSWIKENMK